MAEGPADTCICVYFRDTPECVHEAAAIAAGPLSRLLRSSCRLQFVCAVSPEKRAALFREVMAAQPAIHFSFLPDTASKAEALRYAIDLPGRERYFMWFDSPACLQPQTDARSWWFRAIRQLRVAELVGAVYRAPVTEKHCTWLQQQLRDFEAPCPKYVNCVASNWMLAHRSDMRSWPWPQPDTADADIAVLLGLWLHAKKLRVNHFRDDVRVAAECGVEKALC